MIKSIRKELEELAEEKYRQFSSKLIPNINNVLGVRIPMLHKIAKRIAANGEWGIYLDEVKDLYFEETMLQALVICYIDVDLDRHLKLVSQFVPKINNWSVCDSFCTALKIANKDKTKVWDFLQPYLTSPNAYDIRFAVVMLLMHYVEEDYSKMAFEAFDKIVHDDYYVKMAVAWAVSIYYRDLPEITLPYLKNNKLDTFTHNKALQKIIESLKVKPETKYMIRSLKRSLKQQ